MHVIKFTKAVAQRCSVKKVLLEISQNSQENTCARVSFLIKVQASACSFIKKETLAQVFSCATSLKKRLWHTSFPVNFAKFLRKSFLKKHIWWLLLQIWSWIKNYEWRRGNLQFTLSLFSNIVIWWQVNLIVFDKTCPRSWKGKLFPWNLGARFSKFFYSLVRIWSHLLKKSWMEKLHFLCSDFD